MISRDDSQEFKYLYVLGYMSNRWNDYRTSVAGQNLPMEEIRKGYWKKYGPKPKRSSSPNRRRPKLPKDLHACAGLPAQNCKDAKVCYFQPKAREGKGRCMTRSGKAIVESFNIPGRASVLKTIRGKEGQEYGIGTGHLRKTTNYPRKAPLSGRRAVLKDIRGIGMDHLEETGLRQRGGLPNPIKALKALAGKTPDLPPLPKGTSLTDLWGTYT